MFEGLAKLADFCKRHDAIIRHTSGHAYPEMIKAVIKAVDPVEVKPIHTDDIDAFNEMLENLRRS